MRQALQMWFTWMDHHPLHPKVECSNPGHGAYWRQLIDDSLSCQCLCLVHALSFLSFPSKTNKHILRRGLKKEEEKTALSGVAQWAVHSPHNNTVAD